MTILAHHHDFVLVGYGYGVDKVGGVVDVVGFDDATVGQFDLVGADGDMFVFERIS